MVRPFASRIAAERIHRWTSLREYIDSAYVGSLWPFQHLLRPPWQERRNTFNGNGGYVQDNNTQREKKNIIISENEWYVRIKAKDFGVGGIRCSVYHVRVCRTYRIDRKDTHEASPSSNQIQFIQWYDYSRTVWLHLFEIRSEFVISDQNWIRIQ